MEIDIGDTCIFIDCFNRLYIGKVIKLDRYHKKVWIHTNRTITDLITGISTSTLRLSVRKNFYLVRTGLFDGL